MKKALIGNFILLLIITSVSLGQFDKTDNLSGSSNLGMQTISVTIGGSFIVNGSFAASPFERVDQFVTRIFNLYKSQTIGKLTDQKSIEKYSIELDNVAKRNIRLKHINGKEETLDLEKFRITGDFIDNPYLKNDDVLIFPKVDLLRDFISVDGAVNNPIKFQFVPGDKLSDALLFAQGISDAYENVEIAEIFRAAYNGMSEQSIPVDIHNKDFKLESGDIITVLANETMKKEYKVLVLGEVYRPGYLPITKNTTIRQVIEMAGGFKQTASLFQAELIRSTDRYTLLKKDILTKNFFQNKYDNERIEFQLYENREMEKMLMSRMAYLTEDDTAYFEIDNELRLLKANGLVNFEKIFTDSTEGNFLVKDGDIILIPEQTNLVYVFGQVGSTGYVEYEEGMGVDYYVQKAGGLGETAKELDEAWIIKGKTQNWLQNKKDNNVKIEPGDYIWVPKKPMRTFKYYMDVISPVAGVVGTVVTIALLIVQLTI